MEPVETTKPAEVDNPAATNPPERVEVAVEVMSKLPPEMSSPTLKLAEVPSRPPDKVDVAVEVLIRRPPEITNPRLVARPPAETPAAKVEVAAPATTN